MSTELQIGGDDAREARRPNVAGDLPSMLEAAPMFRRSVVGYDRFQVDTYVRWAEDELATADREREHLFARALRAQAALEETRQLLPHSSSAGEFLRVSTRIGSLLAAAADEAEGLRADAEADRAAAADEVERTTAEAGRLLADATDEARRLLADAAAAAARARDDARRIVADAASEAEQVRRAALSEADIRLRNVQELERRAAEQADRTRRQATEDAAAALLHARDEVVRLLTTGREQRRRADAEAAAARERLEQDVLARTAALRAEVAALERRRTALRGEVRRLTAAAADHASAPVQRPLPRVADALHWRSRSLRAP
jgi:cell division septum initiation protein DivIVA